MNSAHPEKCFPVTQFKFPKSDEMKQFPKDLAYISLDPSDLSLLSNVEDSHHSIILLESSATKSRLYTYVHYKQSNSKGEISLFVKNQKLESNGKVFVLQEIFGQDNESSRGKECSICLVDRTNVMVFPCKHMCLCEGCAKDLRSRTRRCPICRKKIEVFLKVAGGGEGDVSIKGEG